MSRFDGRIKTLEKRMPREPVGDFDIGIGAELDEQGNILNPEEFFADDAPGEEHIYIGYSDEQIRRIEEQRFLYWQKQTGREMKSWTSDWKNC